MSNNPQTPDHLIHAPWTSEQVTALNAFQHHGRMHPFTCGALHASGQSPVLVATHSGWVCPDVQCAYRQDWAHAFMADPAALPAVPVPPATHATVPDRAANAEALLLRFAAEAHRRKWSYDRGIDDDGVPLKSEAFEALHRLGEEMRTALEELRRMADEAQQQETEARPPQHTWRVETLDPLPNEWTPGSHFLSRPAAVERYDTANSNAPLWKDGTPVQRRIVRETTTYTVEQPASGPGRVADEEQPESDEQRADREETDRG